MTKDESKFMKTKALHYWSFNMPAKYKVGTIKAKRIPVRFEGQTYGEFKRKAGNTKTSSKNTGNKKVRNPVNYLVKKGVPKLQAQRFLAQPAVIDLTWKEDTSGPYISSHALDSIAYGWKHERKEITETLASTEKVRKEAMRQLKKEYGREPTMKDYKERMKKIPSKYQKKFKKIERVMKVIKG